MMAKKNSTLEIPENWHKIVLTKYQFKKGSPLQKYLQTKVRQKIYNEVPIILEKLLRYLKYIIKKETLFDQLNPAIILCDSDLEAALNMKALHAMEIKNCVLPQLVLVTPFHSEKISLKQPYYTIETRNSIKQQYYNKLYTKKQVKQQMQQCTFKECYRLKPLLKIALKRMPSFPHHQRTFNYTEICNYLSRYIVHYRNELFDQRNIYLCMVHNDPLGKAFNVNAFHRCQVTSLLRRNIIPVK
jgi:hypothetical protein